jgi:hypothetical protein
MHLHIETVDDPFRSHMANCNAAVSKQQQLKPNANYGNEPPSRVVSLGIQLGAGGYRRRFHRSSTNRLFSGVLVYLNPPRALFSAGGFKYTRCTGVLGVLWSLRGNIYQNSTAEKKYPRQFFLEHVSTVQIGTTILDQFHGCAPPQETRDCFLDPKTRGFNA